MSSHSQVEALYQLQSSLDLLTGQVDQVKILAAQPLVNELRKLKSAVPLAHAEFRVFSQFGDDGIIQYILTRLDLPVAERCFIEFGVENYRAANTRFLLLNNNWTGLVMDGNEDYISTIRQEHIYSSHDLTAFA